MTTIIPIRVVFRLAVLVALLGAAAVAHAQTGPCPTANVFVANPTRGCFNPDMADHTTADPVTGLPMVDHYELQFFAEATDASNPNAQPIQTASLGKPTPNSATPQAIWFGAGTSTPLPAYPVGQRLKAVVVAVGPGGSSPRGVAATSNPFGRSAPATAPDAPSGTRLTPE
jgi:hypothetical protein